MNNLRTEYGNHTITRRKSQEFSHSLRTMLPIGRHHIGFSMQSNFLYKTTRTLLENFQVACKLSEEFVEM